jgi:K+-sensing histidine kinase KdpD
VPESELIGKPATEMNEMIGTLLDFTRLRFHGSLPVTVEEIDLDELVRGVVAELQAAHRKRAIELCASGNLRGRWDPGRIAQLLSNLAANALWHGARESRTTATTNVAGSGSDSSSCARSSAPTAARSTSAPATT